MNAQKEKPLGQGVRWTGKTRGGYMGNYIFVTLVRLLGLRWAYSLLIPVSFYFLFFAPKALKASRDYQQRLGVGGKSFFSRFWNSYRHFFSFGQILLDRIAIIQGTSSKFQFEFDGNEHIEMAIEKGMGMVIVSGHCGNWEIAAHLLDKYKVAVNVVAYEGEAAHIKNFFSRVLDERAFSLIEMDGSMDVSLKIVSALSRGEVVTMHADRVLDLKQKSVEVEFLGAKALFPTGPYLVSAVSGAPLIHAFAMREGTYKYKLKAFPPEYLSLQKRSERSEQLKKWVGLFVGRLEKTLRKYPLQWHNFYPFWNGDKL